MITGSNEFWEVFKKTPGAFASAEAIFLMNVCKSVPKGTYMELGTWRGKSTISALQGLSDGFFILVDPVFEEEEVIREVVGTIAKANPQSVQINICANYSTNVIPKQDNLSYCFIDSGDHSDDLPMTEVKMLEDRMIQGGIIAFHDIFSQFVRVTEAYEYLLVTGKYDPIFFNWEEIFNYVRDNDLENGNDSWHQYPELGHPPNFVGALRKK